jgi:hypothetical protein
VISDFDLVLSMIFSASALIVVSPVPPTLKTWPIVDSSKAALRIALTASWTWQKTRDCHPTP